MKVKVNTFSAQLMQAEGNQWLRIYRRPGKPSLVNRKRFKRENSGGRIMSKLTVKQENFCNYYIETGNASEAYRRAYSCDRMKNETVNRKAAEMLENGKITARVNQLQKALQERSDITKDKAVKELANIALSRVTDVLTARGRTVRIKNLSDLPDEVRASISSIKESNGGIEVKFYNKISAIDRLSKMLGWDSPTVIETYVSPFEDYTDEQLEEFIKENSEVLNELKKDEHE